MTRLAYRGGVTAGVVAPEGDFVQGVSTAFSLGATNVLHNATIESDVALHVKITMNSAQSVSSQMAALRNLLFGNDGSAIVQRVRDVCSVFFRSRYRRVGALTTLSGTLDARDRRQQR